MTAGANHYFIYFNKIKVLSKETLIKSAIKTIYVLYS